MKHIPVLADVIRSINDKYNFQKVIDVTFGAGGHSRLFGDRLVLAMDRDIEAQKHNDFNANLIIDKFSNLEKYMDEDVDLIHADLGLSSMQIQSDRGFSFMSNSPLMMTAGQNDMALYNIINTMRKHEIANILKKYGELNNAVIIASNIDEYRLSKDIYTTYDLISACKINNFSILARIFQAFRIHINDEIYELEQLMKICQKRSKFASIITFHSLEARIVSGFLKSHCKKVKKFKPSKEEIDSNSASRSAVLFLGSFD